MTGTNIDPQPKYAFLRRRLQLLLPYAAAGIILSGLYLIWLVNSYPIQGARLVLALLYLWVFFSLAAYLGWTRFLAPRLAAYSTRRNILWLAGSQIAGFWLADNIPIVLPGGGIVKAAFFLAAGMGTGLLLFLVSVFFVTRARPASAPAVGRAVRRFRWLVFAAPMLVVWVAYLLAFWPGMMSSDSLDQWGQALSGAINNHHPAFHTITIWLLTRIAETPAVVALAQIVALALVAGAVLAVLESLGVAPAWVWAASFLFALTPVNGTMVNTLWKDVPYSTAVLAFTLLVLLLAQSRGAWIQQRGGWLIIGATAALAALFRHNGLPVIVGTFPLLLAGLRGLWKQLVLSAAACLALYFGVTGPGYRLAGVIKPTGLVEAAGSLYVIAAGAGPGSQAEAVLQTMDPLSNAWPCQVFTSLQEARRADGPNYQEDLPGKIQNLVSYAPSILAYNYRCNRSLLWIIWDPAGELRNPSHADYWIDPNPYGITPASKIPALQSFGANFVRSTAYDPSINWLLWRPALYLYLFLFIIATAAMRQRNALILLAAVPVLLQAAGMTMVTMPPNFRYHYAVYLLALAFWPALFLPPACPAGVQPSHEIE